jgi:hypothetical protein
LLLANVLTGHLEAGGIKQQRVYTVLTVDLQKQNLRIPFEPMGFIGNQTHPLLTERHLYEQFSISASLCLAYLV